MIKTGLGFIRITFVSLFLSFFVHMCGVQAQPDNQQGINIKALAQKFIQYIDDINYFTDNELAVNIPGVGQEICVSWGFGGSGNIFTPLPSVPVLLKNASADTNNSLSMVELGKVLIQDEVNRFAKNIELLQWFFAETQLSPLKLFILKVFLLAKDYLRNGLDITTVRSEFFRLLVRLCITENVGITDASKPLSNYLPSFMKEFLNSHLPEALDVLDMVWGIVAGNKNVEDVSAMALNHPHTVYACTFNSKAAADLYFSTLQKANGQRFIHGDDIIKFTNFNGNALPNGMPQELKDAVCSVKNFPSYVKATTADGHYWIGYVVNRFGAYQTAKLIVIALMQTIKKYVHNRQEYFKAHPLDVQRYQQEQDVYYRQQRRIRLFLASESGQASQNRLDKALHKIEQQRSQKTYDAVQKNSRGVELEKELNMLRDSRDKVIEKLDRLNKLYAASPHQKTKNDIAAAKKEIEFLNDVINENEAAQLKLEINRLELLEEKSTDKVIENNYSDDEQKQLDELKEIVRTLKKQGEVIPTDLSKEIEALEKKIAPVTKQITADNVSCERLLSKRECIVQAYRHEAEILEAECAQKAKAFDVKSNDARCNIEKLKFFVSLKPLYEAYIQELKVRADAMDNENKKARELLQCRQACRELGVCSADTKSTNDELGSRCRTLEYEVGWLVDNQSTPGLLHMFMTNNPELKELFAALRGDAHCSNAELKDYLYNALAVIMQQSDHVRDMAYTYRYIIQAIIPGFLPLYEKCVNGQLV